jgi:hypothetical protein
MPGLNGEEVNVATGRGFSQANLCAVDRNPAVVATLKKRFPLLRTYGVDAGRAAERIAAQGLKVQYAHLDFCSPVGLNATKELAAIGGSGCLDHLALVAINSLRGRERDGLVANWRSGIETTADQLGETFRPWHARPAPHPFFAAKGTDEARLSVLATALAGVLIGRNAYGQPVSIRSRYVPFPIRFGIYQSNAGTQTMLWAIYQVHAQPCPCDVCIGMEQSLACHAKRLLSDQIPPTETPLP